MKTCFYVTAFEFVLSSELSVSAEEKENKGSMASSISVTMVPVIHGED